MKEWQLAILARPLFLLAIFAVIVVPLEWLFIRYFPPGRIKRFLLTRW